MIKGYQINVLKQGDIQLMVHRVTPTKPADVNPAAWQKWVGSQDKNFKIEKPPMWWKNVWPRVKDQVNLSLAKNILESVDEASRVWIRVGDDISISIYSIDVNQHKDYTLGPFHPGCLTDHIRVPIDWWNKNIEDITDAIKLRAVGKILTSV